MCSQFRISDVENFPQEPGGQGGNAHALRDLGDSHCQGKRKCLWSALAVLVERCWGLWDKDKGVRQMKITDKDVFRMQNIFTSILQDEIRS